MSKVKYRFNTRTLSYERIELTTQTKLIRISSFILVSAIFGFIFFFVVNNYLDSPREKLLKRENNQLVAQYDLLSKRMDQVTEVLEDIQRRDDEIYRIVF